MSSKKAPPFSEDTLIGKMRARYSADSPILKKGIGDDAAVVHPRGAKEYWVITTDMLLEDIDFHREWTTARKIGCKSIAVNLSDVAAMGARPRFFTVSLAIPPGVSEHWILEFQDGLTEMGKNFGALLLGGDLSRSEKHILISVTAMGESLHRKVLYRSGGKPGDSLYVTGVLGRSAAGLKLLQSGDNRYGSRAKKGAIQAHHMPEPRCEVGVWLAKSGLVSCMMDLSDGLSMDLPRLCAASGTGAEIQVSNLPIFAESSNWGSNPTELALHGGEDYELLFAVPESKRKRLEQIYPSNLPRISRIGTLSGDVGKLWLVEKEKGRLPLIPQGFDHFARRFENARRSVTAGT